MTFVNTVNAYDKKEEAMEEMKQLASFAKHHVPEDHEKDSPQHAAVRAHKLLKNGGCAALVSLTLSESALLTDSIKELIARSVLAMSHRSEDRGLLIQQGMRFAQSAFYFCNQTRREAASEDDVIKFSSRAMSDPPLSEFDFKSKMDFRRIAYLVE